MSDGYERTMRLASERPDLLPVLRRILAAGSEGHFEDESQDDLDELVRRGLITRSYEGTS